MIARRLQLIPNFIFLTYKRLATFDQLKYPMAPVTRKQRALSSIDASNEIVEIPTRKITTLTSVNASNGTVKKASIKPRTNQPITGKDGLPIIPFPSPNDLENWLKINHASTKGLWVQIAKKASGIPTVTYEEMLDVALCFGWIDGQRSSFDETWFIQRISPRRSKSNWSQINREKVKRLIRIGKMQSAGQALIDEAKADGRWDNASKPTSGCVVPDELLAAIEVASPLAQETFRKLSKPSKLAIILQIEKATVTGNGAECIKSLSDMLERGEIPNG